MKLNKLSSICFEYIRKKENCLFKVIKEYNYFYLCKNNYYYECFLKTEYKPNENGFIEKKVDKYLGRPEKFKN